MTPEDKNHVIKISAELLLLNLDVNEKDKKFWIEDFINYLDIQLD